MAGPPAYLIAYDVLSFTSALVITVTILTVICSKQVHRGRAWFGLMACWFVYALSYGILVGKQIRSEPTFAHCLVQTMLIYAAPSLVAIGSLCFYIDFYRGICWDTTTYRPLQPRIANLMLTLPWITHLAIDIEVITVKLTFRNGAETAIKRADSHLFCHLQGNSIPSVINASIVVLSMVFLIPLEIWIGIQFYKRRAAYVDADFRRYLAVYIRMAAYTLIASIGFGLSMITVTRVPAGVNSITQDLSFPCISMGISLIFALQQDLFDVWLCRRRKSLTGSNSELVQSVDQTTSVESKTIRYESTWNPDSSDHSQPLPS